jgi:hypothetical protein
VYSAFAVVSVPLCNSRIRPLCNTGRLTAHPLLPSSVKNALGIRSLSGWIMGKAGTARQGKERWWVW